MNRRQFINGIGAFFILPGAGRIWRAVAPEPALTCLINGGLRVPYSLGAGGRAPPATRNASQLATYACNAANAANVLAAQTEGSRAGGGRGSFTAGAGCAVCE